MKRSILSCAVVGALMFSGHAYANNARDYIPLEPGSYFLGLYYNHTGADDYYLDGDKVNSSMDYTGNVSILRPVYYTSIGSITLDPQLLLPIGEASLADDQSSGLGDATVAATIWFVNNKESKFIFAYTPFITMPTGDYDENSSVNLGANRWAHKHEFCVAKGFGETTWLEVSAYAQFFTDNDDVIGADNAKVELSQEMVYGAEAHLSHNFTPEFFTSLDYIYTGGGETSLNDADQNNELSTHNVGVTFAYMITPSVQLMTNFNTDVSVDAGLKTTTFMGRLGFIF